MAPARRDRRNIAAADTDVGELTIGQSSEFGTRPRTLASFVDGGANAGKSFDNPTIHDCNPI